MVVEVEAPSESAGRAVARLARVVEGVLGELDLTLPQYRLLWMLAEGSAVATALADHLAVTRPSVTALVDGLVQRGLVERQPDTADRRRVGHALTPEGRLALIRAEAAVEHRLITVADHLEPDAATDAVRGLSSWHEALDAVRRQRMAKS